MESVGEILVSLPSIVRINEELNRVIVDTTKIRIRSVLTDISEEYGIARNELLSRYLTEELEIIKDSTSCIKRAKGELKASDMCLAKISTGKQCSRRHRENELYCGSHLASRPYGEFTRDEQLTTKIKPSINRKALEPKDHHLPDHSGHPPPEGDLFHHS